MKINFADKQRMMPGIMFSGRVHTQPNFGFINLFSNLKMVEIKSGNDGVEFIDLNKVRIFADGGVLLSSKKSS
jgi:hypothetical protein